MLLLICPPGRRTAAMLGLALLCAAPLPFIVTSVAAQNNANSADKETARESMNRGLREMNDNNYDAALRAFRGADAIMALPTTRYAVGRALAAKGILVEAREVLLSIRRLPAAGNEPAPLQEARKKAAQLALDISARIPSVTVVVSGNNNYQLFIDERAIVTAAAPLPQRIDPGSHTIVVRAEGYSEVRQTVAVTEAETHTVRITLKKLPTLVIPSPPPALVPERAAPLPAPKDDASNSGGAGLVLAFTGAGMTGVGLIAGAITGSLALGESSVLAELCQGNACPQETAEASFDKTLALSHASTASFAFAGLGAVLATVGVLLMTPEDNDGGKAEAATLRLQLGMGRVGVSGSF